MKLNGIIALLLLVCKSACRADSAFDDPESVLYVTTVQDIRARHLFFDLSTGVVAGVGMAHDVALDQQSGYLYWAIKDKAGASGVFRSKMKTDSKGRTIVEPVLTAGIGAVERISIDWVARHVYILDAERVRIVACEMNGAECAIVLQQDSIQVDGVGWCALALDPESRLMFWADCGAASAHISSAGMDGSHRQVIVKGKMSNPSGLAVDSGRIFWTDGDRGHIESCKLDGSERWRMNVDAGTAYSIDVVKGTVFWSNPRSGRVYACNMNATVPSAVYGKASPIPIGIHIQHPSKQPPMANPCSNNTCSHVCLLSPASSSGFRCACPTGMQLPRPEDSICQDSSGSLVVLRGGNLYQLHHRIVGNDSMLLLPTPGQSGDIGSIAYDSNSNSAIYTRLYKEDAVAYVDRYGTPARRRRDHLESSIYSIDLGTHEAKLLYTGINGMVVDMDVDGRSSDIYWLESKSAMANSKENQTLVKGSLSAGYKTILATGLQLVRSIALAPEIGSIFIHADGAIYSFSMDGKDRKDLGTYYISDLDYYAGYIYFITNHVNTLERMKTDGTERVVLAHLSNQPSRSLSVGASAAFWIQGGVRSMTKAGPTVFQISTSSNVRNLVVVQKLAFNSTRTNSNSKFQKSNSTSPK